VVSLCHNSDFDLEAEEGKYVLGLVLDIVVEVGRVVDSDSDSDMMVEIGEEGNY